MTQKEFEQKEIEEQLFYKDKCICINKGIISNLNYKEVLGCSRISSNGKWCVFETFRGCDRNEGFSVTKLQTFGENEESNAFGYLYKIITSFMKQYKRRNKLVEKMTKAEFLERMKKEKISFFNFYISVDEGMIELKRDVIGCTRPENGSNWRVFSTYCDKATGKVWTSIIKKFKKDEEAAFAYFYNFLTNQDFRKKEWV